MYNIDYPAMTLSIFIERKYNILWENKIFSLFGKLKKLTSNFI